MDWTVPATEVKAGDSYRQLGPGYRARTIASVTPQCNCENSARAMNDDDTPKHYPTVVIEATDGMTFYAVPHSLITLTDNKP